MPKLSLIIPCYNAEKSIHRCFDSIESQTIGINEMELIFVNDASTDNTLEYLVTFEKKYPENVIVVNCSKNGKQGAARNIGLMYATAEYIGFVDDDDAFEPEMFETLYEKAKAYNCDMVMCEFDAVTEDAYLKDKEFCNKSLNSQKQDEFYEISTSNERIALITSDPVRCIWNKIYRKSMLIKNDIKFPEGYIYDDIYFYELVKHYTKRIYKCHQVYYHHIFHEGSASIDFSRKAEMLGYLDVQLLLLEELKYRNLYSAYQESYNEMLMLEAIGLVKSYLMRYGQIDCFALSYIKKKLLPYREEFLLNALLQQLWKADEKSADKKIAQLLITLDE